MEKGTVKSVKEAGCQFADTWNLEERKVEYRMEKLHVDIAALSSLHRFGDILEEAIAGVRSDMVQMQAVRDAGDCIGRHWYGMRCRVTCKRSGSGFYLHIGLIYHPDTRRGLMVELDEQNNRSCYDVVKKNMAENPQYEINRDEPEYFKLFMPNPVFESLQEQKRGEQVSVIRAYVQAAAEGIASAAYEEGFRITIKDMEDARNLAAAFDRALTEVRSSISKVEVNYQDKDNFGQYAQGFRYYLSDQADRVRMYAYFGAIYSYKKMPAGIFAEIDWFSNQQVFDRVFAQIKPSEGYELSIREPKFIKLFMPRETVDKLNEAEYEEQMRILKEFLKNCNDRLVEAWINGGKEHE